MKIINHYTVMASHKP